MYCKSCGQQIDEKVKYCPWCGVNTAIGNPFYVDDAPNAVFAVLGFFMPLVGLILYLVYEDKKPQRAKSAGKGVLIGVITRVAFAVVGIILSIVAAIAFMG